MTEPTTHSYRPSEGHRLAHDPLNSIVAPRPIGWVSTLARDGARNLAPYSFFNLFNYRPPIIGFSSLRWKDSVANVEASGEFVWNLATRPLAEQMNRTSAELPGAVDEFDVAGLETIASTVVAPPRVAASPVTFECRLSRIIRLAGADGAEVDAWLVLGEVVMVHIRADLVREGAYDTVAAEPVLRGGGPADYFTIDDAARFRMMRPGAAPEAGRP
ncbi:flavin reductase family protein [Agromyces sp. CFH 90414]|uniref:Flavin reductase family protein n=1 Tax=Agromyces agglutinans TaxID=2662258 RepID=A0A6I2F9I4_9MICO|nr:flavin reductase family protein [Agromyces agglutinans]MRG60971.1 flavin reductase family protein [Agromyces agglutinans]